MAASCNNKRLLVYLVIECSIFVQSLPLSLTKAALYDFSLVLDQIKAMIALALVKDKGKDCTKSEHSMTKQTNKALI